MKTEAKTRDILFWTNEIEAAKKREKDFRSDGKRILEIYEGKEPDKTPFNILFSNTETLYPALYSSVPRPVVQRRFKDDDPLGKASSVAATRMLEFLLDTNIEGYETFDDGMKANTLDALLPGRGVLTVKYDADVVTSEEMSYKKSELVCVDTKSWDKVLFGYAKKWSRVPWVAYEEQIEKKEAVRLFGEAIAKELQYTKEKEEEDKDERDTGERKTTTIYQIWDKDTRKIRYISMSYPKYLLVEDDPLGLTGFFNCPRPLKFVETTNDLTPVSLYKLYENQAKELNELTRRIKRVTAAIKAKAIYDGELGEDIKNLVEADDNQLFPADKSSSLAAEKGMDNAIWFWPIDKLIIVLQQLMVAREACKQVIYEIMGIADIMRGASKASETLGAQEIKTQWGTLRIKPKQAEVQRYARDVLRIMLEISTKFSEETWAKMTGLPYLTTEQVQQMQMMMQAMQSQVQMQPELQEQMQQVQMELQKPTWEQVLGLLRDDLQRSYKIDIETNSTVLPEAAEDQKQITESMTAMGQYLNGVAPLVSQGVMPFEVAQSMLMTIARRFRFGDDVEELLKGMKAPPPPDDGKAAAAAEQQAKQAELETQQKVEMAKHQREVEAEQAKAQLEMAKLQTQKEIEFAKLQAERENELIRIEAEKKENMANLAAERATEKMKAEMHQDTELKKAALMAQTQLQIATMTTEQKDKAAGTDKKIATLESTDSRIKKIEDVQAEILSSIMKPRRNRAIRGKDGKIAEVISETIN